MQSPLVEHQIRAQEDQNIKQRMLPPLVENQFVFMKIRI
jgi:hypothetical protein